MAGHPYNQSNYSGVDTPNQAPQSVNAHLDFSNHKLEISWMIPYGCAPTYTANPRRWTSTDIEIRPFSRAVGGSTATCPSNWEQNSNQGGDALKLGRNACIYVRNLESGDTIATSFSQAYDPEQWYPYTNYVLDRIEVTVIAHNSWGGHGATTTKVAKLAPPNSPVLTGTSYSPSTGIVSYTLAKPSAATSGNGITPESAYTQRDWLQNVYRMTYKSHLAPSTVKVLLPWTATSLDSKTVEADLAELVYDGEPDVMSLAPGQWVYVEFQAFSEGMGGTKASVSNRSSAASLSASGMILRAHWMFAWPARGSVTKVTASSLDYSGGSVTVLVKVSPTDTAPVDSVALQRIKNTAAKTPEAAASASDGTGWQTVAKVSASTCGGFSDTVADALPDRGKRTWYRVVTTNGTYTSYGAPVEAECLRRDSNILTDDALQITSAAPGDDGKSIVVDMKWSGDDSDGVEVSWSDRADAWQSTEQPSTHDVTWTTGARQTRLTIRGLEEGTPYYVKARLYHDTDDYREFGDYVTPPAAQYPVAPVTVPADVRLSAPGFVERGADVPLRWTFQGAEQTGWTLWDVTGGSRVALMSGEDSLGSCVVPSEMLGTLSAVSLAVSVTTGGAWADSDAVTVSVADRPEVSVRTPATLDGNALVASVTTDCASAGVSLAVYATGTATAGPMGPIAQPAGEVLWSTYAVPALAQDGDGFTADIPCPRMELYDGSRYVVAATAVDLETGLESETSTCEFSVDWAHKAGLPASVDITPYPGSQQCDVEVAPPAGHALADCYDLYRVTPDGAQLAGTGLMFNRPYLDPFAPYSNDGQCSYRVCVRTYDGDMAWMDCGYEARGAMMRIDWDGKHVSLPYNLEVDDSFAKDFELKRHIDGTPNGYWNPGAERSASVQTQLVKGVDAESAALLRELARYAGPAFVRTPDGCAYAANVEVGRITRTYGSKAVDVSLATAEVTLPDDFAVAGNEFDWSA